MELIVAVAVLAVLGVLSVRFGQDSRESMYAEEHNFARVGLAWDAPRAPVQRADAMSTQPTVPTLRDSDAGAARIAAGAIAPVQVTWVSLGTSGRQVDRGGPLPYPTLCLLDQARGPAHRPFADDLAAPALERRAQQLVADYWSGNVWLTGHVSRVALTTVCDALERERSLSDAAITVVATPASTLPSAREQIAAPHEVSAVA